MVASHSRAGEMKVSFTINNDKLADLGMEVVHHDLDDGRVVYTMEVRVGGDLPFLNPEFVRHVEQELGERAKFEMEEEAMMAYARIGLRASIR